MLTIFIIFITDSDVMTGGRAVVGEKIVRDSFGVTTGPTQSQKNTKAHDHHPSSSIFYDHDVP